MSWLEDLPGFRVEEKWSPEARAAALAARKRNAALRGGALARGVAISHKDLEDHGHEYVGEGPWSGKVDGHVKRLQKSDALDLDTQKLHTDAKGNLSPERAALHRRILALHLRGHEPGKGARESVFFGGGPASGKSTLVTSGKVSLPDDSVLVNPDVIKNMIPEYRKLIEAGDTSASAKVHEESSVIAEKIRRAALARGHDTVIDKVKIKPEHVREARAKGYRTRGVIVTARTKTAVDRARVRAERTKRYVDPKVIADGHREVSQQFPAVVRTHLPIDVYDTERGHMISQARGGRVHAIDPGAHREFLDKARP